MSENIASHNANEVNVLGLRMLIRLATALRTIGQGSSEESFEWIGMNAPSVEVTLRGAVERAPKATMRVVSDMLLEMSVTQKSRAIERVLLGLGTDPRNFREAARTLEGIAKLIKGHDLEKAVDAGLATLEARGALGLATLERLAMFLYSVKMRPHMLRLEPCGVLRSGDATIDIDKLGSFGRSLGTHSVMWGRRAAHDSLQETYGKSPQRLTGEWVRQEGLLPEPFAKAGALEILKEWSMVRPERSFSGAHEEGARHLYFAFWALEQMVQPEWWGRFRPDLIFVDGPIGGGIEYDSDRKSILIGEGPARASSAVEALVRAMDHNLMDGQSFASETDGHPIEIFVGMLEGLYSDESGRDRFARFSEHYMRIYMNQLGSNYAEIEAEGDPPAGEVAGLSKNYMDSLVEGQHIDLSDEVKRSGDAALHGFGASSLGVGTVVLGSAMALR